MGFRETLFTETLCSKRPRTQGNGPGDLQKQKLITQQN